MLQLPWTVSEPAGKRQILRIDGMLIRAEHHAVIDAESGKVIRQVLVDIIEFFDLFIRQTCSPAEVLASFHKIQPAIRSGEDQIAG